MRNAFHPLHDVYICINKNLYIADAIEEGGIVRKVSKLYLD